uniref:Uncharacterized protein n=1 Tax=Tetradesmus obliquus TaxID=3088 RepID=A0A383VGI8_TETOB
MPELPCPKELHQHFVTHALLDCAKLPEDGGVLAQPRSQQASSSSSWQCSSVQAAYQAALLQYGDDPADLQHLIATFASAVLRVSQSLGSAAGQLLQQRAFSAADQHIQEAAVALQRVRPLRAACAVCSTAVSGTSCMAGIPLSMEDS